MMKQSKIDKSKNQYPILFAGKKTLSVRTLKELFCIAQGNSTSKVAVETDSYLPAYQGIPGNHSFPARRAQVAVAQ